jgi:Aerotolerance regulator N-terminal
MSFIHPAFLGALGALSIPLAIHFLRSRKLKQLDLGTLRFVREAMAETTRWQRLREWLLLLMRLAMVALAAFLFARPFLRQDTPPPGMEAGSEWICVLDASASMRFQKPGAAPAGTVPANSALEAFAHRRDDMPPGIKAVPLVLADNVEPVADATEAAKAAGGPCDFTALARWLTARTASSPKTPRRVFFFTDLQQPAGSLPPDVTWPAEVPFEIVSVLPPATRNLAAGAPLHRVQPFVAGKEVTMQIPLVRSGDTAPQKFTAGAGPGTDFRSLPEKEYAADAQEIALTLKPDKPGDVDSAVRVKALDAWPMDDQRPFVIRFSDRQPVLLVDGDPGLDDNRPRSEWEAPGGSPFASEVYYLRHALATPDRGQTASAFDAVVTREAAADLDAKPWKAIALCNVAFLDEPTLTKLADRVKAGTGLVIFPGDKCDTAAWQRIHDAGLCPAVISPNPDPAVPRPLAEWDGNHPALATFATRENGDLSRIILKDKLILQPDTDARVLAGMGGAGPTLTLDVPESKPIKPGFEIPGKRPALLTKQFGTGRIVLFANPADRDWTDFPSERLYLPFVQALFRYAAQTGTSEEEGMPPDRALTLADHRLPGRYSDALLHVAEEESTAPFMDEEAFRKMLRLGDTPAPLVLSGNEAWQKVEGAPRPDEWWPWLALGLLLFIITETFLADHKRPARAAS